MTRDEAVQRIRNYLGFNTRLDAAIIIGALKDAQHQLEHSTDLPWFLVTEVSSITTAPNESRVPLPSDFLREYEDEALYLYKQPSWIVLEKRDVDDLRVKYGDATGEPKFYGIDANYFRLYPIPDDQYTLKLVYYAADQVLDSNIENKWLKYAPQVLIASAGILISNMTRDAGAGQIFREMLAISARQLQNEGVARKAANRRYVMGGED